MIVGYVNGQSLELHHSSVVEKSVDYLTADFQFMTNEWKGFRKWVHFSKGDIHYQIELKNDKVLKTDHLNLSSGEWDVYVHGSLEREVITTNKAKLIVESTGELEGEYPEETPIPPYDDILNKMGDIKSLKTTDKSNLVNAINEVLRKANQGGGTGEGGNGVGIDRIEQTTTSTESSGTNVIRVYLTNGDIYNFEVRNGRGIKRMDLYSQDIPIDEDHRDFSKVVLETTYSDNTTGFVDFLVPYGKDGKSGVYVGSGDMPDGYNVQIDPDGEATDIPTRAEVGNLNDLETKDKSSLVKAINELVNDNFGSESVPGGDTIPLEKTKLSEFENDVGYITEERFETQAENEEPTYGEELASADGWTADGWTGDFANGFTHTTGNTNSLIFTMPEDTAQNTYRISFRCSESIAVESLMVKCGGSELFDLYGQPYDLVTLGIVSVENGNIEFVPASTFKGTITDISIKRVTGFNATEQIITDSTGEISCEMRTTKSSLDNVFIGKHSGENNISGVGCVALGSSALKNNTSGFWNVGVGLNALRDNTVGSRNVGIGYIALAENITGTRNIAIGTFALNHNKTGNKNIAIGADCLDKNESGSENVAIGLQALYHNVSGSKNTAVGATALTSSTGSQNTAVGYGALRACTTGNTNVALGYCAGNAITTGSNNFALGANALYKLKTGSNNIGIGVQAGRGQGTTAGFKHGIFIGANTGYSLNNNADYNILIGYSAGYNITTGTNNIVIGENIDTPTPTTSYWVNIGGLYEGSRNTADKYAKINGGLQLSDIPTTDPAIAGRVWNDNGILKVSAG